MYVTVKGRFLARTELGESWNEGIEPFFGGLTASNGRMMLRNGQVSDITVRGGSAISTISDGKDRIQVKITFDPISDDLMNRISALLGNSAILGKIEGNLSSYIFPKKDEIHSNCDICGDSVFCKHVAATLFGIGAMLDEDQNTLLKLRMLNTDSMVKDLVMDRYTKMISMANSFSPRIIPDDIASKLFKI